LLQTHKDNGGRRMAVRLYAIACGFSDCGLSQIPCRTDRSDVHRSVARPQRIVTRRCVARPQRIVTRRCVARP